MIYLLAYLIFTGTGIWWFLHRMGDKLGKDKRQWVTALDWFLIVPLMPYAFLIGAIGAITKNRNR